MFSLYGGSLVPARVCKVTLEKRSYTRTHTTIYIARPLGYVVGVPRRVARSTCNVSGAYYLHVVCIMLRFSGDNFKGINIRHKGKY
jgi:hypothetical protein